MTSTKPYFIRALYEWIVDNNCTPHLVVDTTDPRCQVPVQFVKNNSIVLNVAPSAVRNLELGAEYVTFGARFGGMPHELLIPITSVRAIFARENNQGLAFEDEPAATDLPQGAPAGAVVKAPKKATHLTVVK